MSKRAPPPRMCTAWAMILTSGWGFCRRPGGGGGCFFFPGDEPMTRNTINFVQNFCVGIFWPVHPLQASLGRMLCTSCIFVMVEELTLATFGAAFAFAVIPPPGVRGR